MTARPPFWRLREYASLPSTSDLCAQLAQAGEPAGLAVLATRQTAGRGSRGRTWESLPGNLAFSVLLRPPGSPAASGHWALLSAVALAEALEQSGAPSLQVKWPNDVLLGGRKLAGVLLDSAAEGGRILWLVIGFGANLAAAPDLPGATSLPHPLPPRRVADALMARLEHWRVVVLTDGFGPVRQAWLARGPELGAHLRIQAGGAELGGAFAGLAEDGALLLQSGGRVRAFPTGDVLLGI